MEYGAQGFYVKIQMAINVIAFSIPFQLYMCTNAKAILSVCVKIMLVFVKEIFKTICLLFFDRTFLFRSIWLMTK